MDLTVSCHEDFQNEREAAPRRVEGNCKHPRSQMVFISCLTSAVMTSNLIAVARRHKQNSILYLPVLADSVAAGIYRRRLHDGTQSCLTRIADSEHILIYSTGPGAGFTGLSTSNSRRLPVLPGGFLESPYLNMSLIIPAGTFHQFTSPP